MSRATTTAEGQYPEHAKLRAIQDRSQSIGEFLEWVAAEKGAQLAAVGLHDRWWPIPNRIEALLAEFFDIDLETLEREKQAVLDEIRRP